MFDLIKGTIQSSKVIEDINGDSVFINLSKNKEFKKIKEFELNNENIFISNVSPLGLIQYYNGKCSYSNLLYHIKPKDNYKDKINIKYIYYYLLEKKEYIEINYQKGLANKSLDVEKFKLLEIPIATLEIQEEIVKYLDELFENNNKETLFNYNNNKLFEWLLYNPEIKDIIKLFYEIESSNIDINNTITKLYELNKSKIKIVKFNTSIIIKTLGEICKYKSGKRLPEGHKLQDDKTPYPYIRITNIDNNSISLNNIKYISQETKNIINKYIITINDIFITIAGTTGLVGIIPLELDGANLTENAISISIINNNEILQKYLLYNLQYNQQEELKKNTLGLAIPKLSIERLMTLNIPIPSLEVQEEIINYCDNNLEVINNLKKIIEDNNKMMKDLFS